MKIKYKISISPSIFLLLILVRVTEQLTSNARIKSIFHICLVSMGAAVSLEPIYSIPGGTYTI